MVLTSLEVFTILYVRGVKVVSQHVLRRDVELGQVELASDRRALAEERPFILLLEVLQLLLVEGSSHVVVLCLDASPLSASESPWVTLFVIIMQI